MHYRKQLLGRSSQCLRRVQHEIDLFLGDSQHNRSTKELARRIGLSVPTFYRLMDRMCDYSLSLNTLFLVADVLELNPAWLLTGQGERTRAAAHGR